MHVAEKALTIWMVLDVSPSMAFGTADRLKADVAEGIVFVLGHLSARGGNSIGAATFGDRNPQTLLPRGGRDGTYGLLKLLRQKPDPEALGATSPAEVRLESPVLRAGVRSLWSPPTSAVRETGEDRCSGSPAATR